MAKDKKTFVCSNCGCQSTKWAGRCSHCGEWNTIEEHDIVEKPSGISKNIPQQTLTSGRKLKDVESDKNARIMTGITEFDRVLGGGLVIDSFNLLMAPPGTGKSTLAIMVADKLTKKGYKVLYASGEESASQIKNRANRLKLKYADEIYIADTSNLDFVISEIEKYDIDLIILDSIQTFYLNEFLPSRQGNPTQTNAVVNSLKDLCKQSNRPHCCIAISQLNKKEEVAGYNSIPHIVDACLYLDGDSTDPLRIFHATKNRFGDTEEAGFFYMRADGLNEISDISNFFVTERDYDVIGVSVTGIKEANRYAMCEIETLTPKTFTAFPSRISSNIKKDDLNVLVSILEQRARMVMADKNVILKTTGNINIHDNSANLAVLMSIVSSYYNKPIDNKIVFYGDVSLTGEIKKCPNIESFANELDRLGYKKLYIAENVKLNKKYKQLQVINISDINKLIEHFKRGDL